MLLTTLSLELTISELQFSPFLSKSSILLRNRSSLVLILLTAVSTCPSVAELTRVRRKQEGINLIYNLINEKLNVARPIPLWRTHLTLGCYIVLSMTKSFPKPLLYWDIKARAQWCPAIVGAIVAPIAIAAGGLPKANAAAAVTHSAVTVVMNIDHIYSPPSSKVERSSPCFLASHIRVSIYWETPDNTGTP